MVVCCALAILVSPACTRSPRWVALPAQWPSFDGAEPKPFGAFVEMSDPHVQAYLSRDFAMEINRDSLRWAFRNPELRFWLEETGAQVFIADFAVHSLTFASTGPVTIHVSIEGRSLGRIRCAHDGEYHFERPVPAAWLRTDRPILVTLIPDRVWVSPQDGGVLSFLLRRAGFRHS
jgi:hypothetical protein